VCRGPSCDTEASDAQRSSPRQVAPVDTDTGAWVRAGVVGGGERVVGGALDAGDELGVGPLVGWLVFGGPVVGVLVVGEPAGGP
jgi:hypothetical protein